VALKDNFPETDGSTQAASILFYVSSKWPRHFLTKQLFNHPLLLSSC
jgi:hypothetical protein